jgi:hypothetical protein
MSCSILVDDENLDALQKTADYRVLRGIFKSAGIASIIFGVIAVAVGAWLGIGYTLFNNLWILFGIFLFGVGIWLIAGMPRQVGLIAYGMLFVLAGMWNVIGAGSMINILYTGNPIYKIIYQLIFILGIFQIIWGVQIIPRYGRFSGVSIQKPSEENQRWFDQAVNSISGAKPEDSRDIIEFKPRGFNENKWKGKLEEEVAIFVQGKVDDMFIATKEQVKIIDYGNTPRGKSLWATLQIRNRKIKAIFSPESFKRYETWKSGDTV